MPATRRVLRLSTLALVSTLTFSSTALSAAHAADANERSNDSSAKVETATKVKKSKKLHKAVKSGPALSRPERVEIKVDHAESVAKAQIGDAYSYGSAGPSAFDCSGLMYYSFRRSGIAVPRTSSAQAGFARKIGKDQLEPGDLMFFGSGYGVYHVGMFVGRTKGGAPLMLHAPRPGDRVRIEVPWTAGWFAGTLRPVSQEVLSIDDAPVVEAKAAHKASKAQVKKAKKAAKHAKKAAKKAKKAAKKAQQTAEAKKATIKKAKVKKAKKDKVLGQTKVLVGKKLPSSDSLVGKELKPAS